MTKRTPSKVNLIVFIVALISLQLALITCMHHDDRAGKPVSTSEMKEPLIHANKEAVETESEQIQDFLRRHDWKTTETGSGLRYWIYENGDGPMVEKGDVVDLEYTISLLNGDTAYTSREKGNMVFVPGRAQVISGLEEGILLLRKGDRAKFIIPSHLAFGLIGDQDKIGQKNSLVYDIHVLKTEKQLNNP